MGKKLTERQAVALEAIRDWVREHGEAPTQLELARVLGVSGNNAVTYYLDALSSKGWIRKIPFEKRGIVLVDA